jgi:hypothetical protein
MGLSLMMAGAWAGEKVCGHTRFCHRAAMSLTEIQSQVETLPPSERIVLAAYLRHLARRDEAANGRALDAAATRMEAGEKVSRAQLASLHETLKAGGL